MKDSFGQEIILGDAVVVLNGSSAYTFCNSPDNLQLSFVTRFGEGKVEVTRCYKSPLNNEVELYSSYISLEFLVVVTRQFESTLPEQYEFLRTAVSSRIKFDEVKKKTTVVQKLLYDCERNIYYITSTTCDTAPWHRVKQGELIKGILSEGGENSTYSARFRPILTICRGTNAGKNYRKNKYSSCVYDGHEFGRRAMRKLTGIEATEPITVIDNPDTVAKISDQIALID